MGGWCGQIHVPVRAEEAECAHHSSRTFPGMLLLTVFLGLSCLYPGRAKRVRQRGSCQDLEDSDMNGVFGFGLSHSLCILKVPLVFASVSAAVRELMGWRQHEEEGQQIIGPDWRFAELIFNRWCNAYSHLQGYSSQLDLIRHDWIWAEIVPVEADPWFNSSLESFSLVASSEGTEDSPGGTRVMNIQPLLAASQTAVALADQTFIIGRS